ncbi:MAG: ROK family protein [Clostridia bacterium]
MKEWVLAFDMGGSKLCVGLVNREGTILWEKKQPWAPRSGSDVMEALLCAGKEALLQNPDISPSLIGATIPGIADPERGIWLNASFSGIHDLAVAEELSKAFALPAFADNDGQACALAEHMFGAGRNCDDFLYLTISNGIGGGVFCGGKLLKGAYNGAGELGHCTVVENGRLCNCGKHGCLEAYAAGPGISQTYYELFGGEKTGEELAQMAHEGDENALRCWALEGEYLGCTIAFAANVLNPQRVILGGGLSLAFALYEASLKLSISRHLFRKPNEALEVMATPLGYHGGLLGAAAVAFYRAETKNEANRT